MKLPYMQFEFYLINMLDDIIILEEIEMSCCMIIKGSRAFSSRYTPHFNINIHVQGIF